LTNEFDKLSMASTQLSLHCQWEWELRAASRAAVALFVVTTGVLAGQPPQLSDSSRIPLSTCRCPLANQNDIC
jgi:hypothetical protein